MSLPPGLDGWIPTLSGWLLFLLGYAEIHYRLPGLAGRLFRREPEIVFDLPFRSNPADYLPLFLFIKDAHRYPLHLLELSVSLQPETGQMRQQQFMLNRAVSAPFYSETFRLDIRGLALPQQLAVDARLRYRSGNKEQELRQDNYPGISHAPLSIYCSGSTLPSANGLAWGDCHLHSSYTEDQIEFGAPLRETVHCARQAGLQFIAVTDHSYDLDNHPDSYLRNDPALGKWQRFREECRQLEDELQFPLLAGEEVSAGNCRGENVHCLLLGNEQYYPGCGDSGERPLRNRPTLPLPQLLAHSAAEKQVVVAAAHPFEKPPLAQRLLLNRGYWHGADLRHAGLHYWQILNGLDNSAFQEGLQRWRRALLAGQRIGILAGNDAHGNFNTARQIAIPLWKMVRLQQQVLGEMRTGILLPDRQLNRNNLLEALQQGRSLISNGPLVILTARQDKRQLLPGGVLRANKAFTVEIEACSTAEFGELAYVNLLGGSSGAAAEQLLIQPAHLKDGKIRLEFAAGSPAGYLRAEAFSRKGERQFFCYCNPLWIS